MAESHCNQSSAFEMQKESGSAGDTHRQTDKSEHSDGACNNPATGNSNNLEDLFSTLHKQISNSDWLKKNTAEKWVEENPELAKEYVESCKKS